MLATILSSLRSTLIYLLRINVKTVFSTLSSTHMATIPWRDSLEKQVVSTLDRRKWAKFLINLLHFSICSFILFFYSSVLIIQFFVIFMFLYPATLVLLLLRTDIFVASLIFFMHFIMLSSFFFCFFLFSSHFLYTTWFSLPPYLSLSLFLVNSNSSFPPLNATCTLFYPSLPFLLSKPLFYWLHVSLDICCTSVDCKDF